MVYAQISIVNVTSEEVTSAIGVIQNIILLDDETLIPLFIVGFDYCVRIDNLDLQVSIGDFYDGTNFFLSDDITGE